MSTSHRGAIKTIIYDSGDGYIIAALNDKEKVRGHIFHLPGELKDVDIEFYGLWKDSEKYGGREFHFTEYRVIENYDMFFLTKMVKGISKSAAQEIIRKCGKNLERILEEDPNLLLSVRGVGSKKLQSIVDSFRANKHMKELAEFLLPHGVTTTKVKKIYEFYKTKDKNAVAEIKKNPYILTRMNGMGFKRADELALRIGHKPESTFRIHNGIIFALNNALNEEGHTMISRDKLFAKASELLQIVEDEKIIYALERESYTSHIKTMLLEKRSIVAVDDEAGFISSPSLYEAEKQIFNTFLAYGRRVGTPLIDNIEEYIDDTEKKLGFSLDSNQKKAIRLGNENHNIFYVAGVAGAGKTTISEFIIHLYAKKYGVSSVVCCALSGVAANRIQTLTGYRGMTIHSLLGFQGDNTWEFNDKNKLPYRFIILDEASMTDSMLFKRLIDAVDFDKTSIQIVGDYAQLPSVSPGDFYRNIIENKLCEGVNLVEPHRQRPDQVINTFATKYVRRGQVPEDYRGNYEDFEFIAVDIKDGWKLKNSLSQAEYSKIREENSIKILDQIKRVSRENSGFVELYGKGKIRDYISSFQVLTPQKAHILGVYNLNKELQQIFNPSEYKTMLTLPDGKKIKPRDKVIHLKNDQRYSCTEAEYKANKERIPELIESKEEDEKIKVYNGQIGVVIKIMPAEDIICVYYPNEGYVAFYDFSDFKDETIDLSFAISIHKYQGSQCHKGIMVFSMSHYNMLTNTLTYTGMTRPKQHLYCIGETAAFKRACTNVKDSQRRTVLDYLAKQHAPKRP